MRYLLHIWKAQIGFTEIQKSFWDDWRLFSIRNFLYSLRCFKFKPGIFIISSGDSSSNCFKFWYPLFIRTAFNGSLRLSSAIFLFCNSSTLKKYILSKDKTIYSIVPYIKGYDVRLCIIRLLICFAICLKESIFQRKNISSHQTSTSRSLAKEYAPLGLPKVIQVMICSPMNMISTEANGEDMKPAKMYAFLLFCKSFPFLT